MLEWADWYAIAMPYLPNVMDLADYNKEHDDLPQSIEIFKNLFKTVFLMFEAGYVHNDLKPENVLVNPDTLEVTLIDFDAAGVIKSKSCGLCQNGNLSSTRNHLEQGKQFGADDRLEFGTGAVRASIQKSSFCTVAGCCPWWT